MSFEFYITYLFFHKCFVNYLGTLIFVVKSYETDGICVNQALFWTFFLQRYPNQCWRNLVVFFKFLEFFAKLLEFLLKKIPEFFPRLP